MNQLCKVCGEPAAGFHFGAFTCEGCKSFFGRTYNNISAIAGCKNNGDCVINKKNRTACKACRLRKCLLVGMSKSGSRYGRRSNWFKIHCLLQEQQSQHHQIGNSQQQITSNFEQLNHLHQQLQARQTYQDKTNPSIKTANLSPSIVGSILSNHSYLPTHFLNGNSGNLLQTKSEPRLSSPSDSGASSADPDDNNSNRFIPDSPINEKNFKKSYRSSSEPLKLFSPLCTNSKLSSFSGLVHGYTNIGLNNISPIQLISTTTKTTTTSTTANLSASISVQDEPIDLSVKSRNRCRTESPQQSPTTQPPTPPTANNVDIPKPAPLDLTLVRSQPMSG